jgi:HSP20 family molecular chaperone IbpA
MPEGPKITAAGSSMTIQAPMLDTQRSAPGKYLSLERYKGEMIRAIDLPMQTEPDRVESTYEHGVFRAPVAMPIDGCRGGETDGTLGHEPRHQSA